MSKLDLSKIVFYGRVFPEKFYFKQATDKNQIIIRNTRNGMNAYQEIKNWDKKTGATFIINKDGSIHQLFSSQYWARSFTVKSETKERFKNTLSNIKLNKGNLTIMLQNSGPLMKNQSTKTYHTVTYCDKTKSYKPNLNTKPISPSKVSRINHNNFKYYEKYSLEQINSLGQLLVFLCERYDITKEYKEDIWDINERALSGENGIWTISSYGDYINTPHPQPDLVGILSSINDNMVHHGKQSEFPRNFVKNNILNESNKKLHNSEESMLKINILKLINDSRY